MLVHDKKKSKKEYSKSSESILGLTKMVMSKQGQQENETKINKVHLGKINDSNQQMLSKTIHEASMLSEQTDPGLDGQVNFHPPTQHDGETMTEEGSPSNKIVSQMFKGLSTKI